MVIHYIPGNHDKFVYDYGLKRKHKHEHLLRINGGTQTIKDINNLRNSNRELLSELIDWLGSRPLQVKHTGRDDKPIVLLMRSLMRNFIKQIKIILYPLFMGANHLLKYELENVLWFRKYEDKRASYYSKSRVPSSDNIIVIGHTPSTVYDKDKYNLIGSDNKEVKVMCVDGGVTFNYPMLKYEGGNHVVMSSPFNEEEIHEGRYPYYSIDDILNNYLSAESFENNSISKNNQKIYYLKRNNFI